MTGEPSGNVQDAALGLEAIAGPDPLDPTSLDQPVVSWSKRLERPVRGLKAGVPKELLGLGVDSGVRRAFDRALEELSHLGLIIEEVSLPSLAYALDAYYIIAPSEASSNHRGLWVRYGLSLRDKGLEEMYRDTRGKGFGPEVRLRVMLGTFALSAGYYDAYYLRAAKIRTLVRREFEKAFETCDVLLSPTTPSVAFAAGDRMMDPYMMYMTDVMTVPVNLAGLPAMSVPCGFALPEGEDSTVTLPCGLQIIGRPFDEETVLVLGYAVESAGRSEMEERAAAMRNSLVLLEECERVD